VFDFAHLENFSATGGFLGAQLKLFQEMQLY
jgi:hypothetical protein